MSVLDRFYCNYPNAHFEESFCQFYGRESRFTETYPNDQFEYGYIHSNVLIINKLLPKSSEIELFCVYNQQLQDA